ncbi:Uncharacterised protein [Yersinia intermedia]|jgi:hypothetical protein|uniref:Uncharacterized protein n=1 Tax=Yersinia intermedia TaxID=631 RepID=A0A0T9M717_YERIN|nr:hypothetical protein CH53_2796 [Yersinia intermedia]EEQ18260.1 hypothetical protein yinte0001_28650 [Yersinia intermedia ATCC 29909]CND63906.1 Uncharacterised protein [Yersinia intermedia]CNF69297.1 Uncharacterised protein [Yersinia intermedia]CNI20184.1 Uncharacterised protein [Yersinia intermedia]
MTLRYGYLIRIRAEQNCSTIELHTDIEDIYHLSRDEKILHKS